MLVVAKTVTFEHGETQPSGGIVPRFIDPWLLYMVLRLYPDDVITFAHFEEGNVLDETRDNAESGDEYDNESIMMSKQDMVDINSGDESDHDLISTDILEDICDGSQTHPNVNKR